jgi:prepilin-type N-terminal cleavage/methylation domain-containing protein
MNHRAQAFTLAELLVVVTIIAILVSMLFPSVHAAYSLAQEKTCNANLSVISKAILAYCGNNKDQLPKNDDKNWSNTGIDPTDLLPGANSNRRWWCNKIYPLGTRNRNLYRCVSDPLHFNESSQVICSYGFNNTLTDPSTAGGDGVTTVMQISDLGMTFLAGHCSSVSLANAGLEPAIAEDMVSDPSKWPIGHVTEYDREARERLGRCGFIMASGDIKVYTYGQAGLKIKAGRPKAGQPKFFRNDND